MVTRSPSANNNCFKSVNSFCDVRWPVPGIKYNHLKGPWTFNYVRPCPINFIDGLTYCQITFKNYNAQCHRFCCMKRTISYILFIWIITSDSCRHNLISIMLLWCGHGMARIGLMHGKGNLGKNMQQGLSSDKKVSLWLYVSNELSVYSSWTYVPYIKIGF